ncbi:histidine phosphotransferase ChpT [Loktanella sp. DSM 29012]|uniref:histidine phosphotransferase family protein n=1 Tax=Loktanella sp. DSM 29012 TaxID=1881056 RepID=UPI0008B4D1B2|nr:histidine phosphotransferase family protein [Loktanella sp. DSM 29012]SEQ20620.1 histidine phosphotransferase ChpT [Loktanella sp. DSM 29012]
MSRDLATLVGSRICHDLISPIGAIGNGVELLSMGGGGADEMDLISGSVGQASARIRFFRIAYGAAHADQTVAGTEVSSILRDMAAAGRMQYDWTITGQMSRPLARIALLSAQCMESAMPGGGKITVMLDDTLHVIANADRIAADTALWLPLEDLATEHVHSAAQVQFALLPRAVLEAGLTLTVMQSDTTISMQFREPDAAISPGPSRHLSPDI